VLRKPHKIQKRLQKSQQHHELRKRILEKTTRQMAELHKSYPGVVGAQLLGTVAGEFDNGCLRRSRVCQEAHESMA
jgi:hypothetical protein